MKLFPNLPLAEKVEQYILQKRFEHNKTYGIQKSLLHVCMKISKNK